MLYFRVVKVLEVLFLLSIVEFVVWFIRESLEICIRVVVLKLTL